MRNTGKPGSGSDPDARHGAKRLTLEHYQRSVRAGHVGIWEWRVRTGEFFICHAMAAILGCRPQEFAGHIDRWISRVHPDDPRWLPPALPQLRRSSVDRWQGEHRFRHKNGSYRWLLTHAILDRNDKGAVTAASGTCTDITDRKETESRLMASEARHRCLVESLPVGLLEFVEQTISYANGPMASLLGESDPLRLLGCSLRSVFTASSWKKVDRLIRPARRTGPAATGPVKAQLARRDGTVSEVELTLVQPVDAKAGAQRIMVRDLKEQLEAERATTLLAEVQRSNRSALAMIEAEHARIDFLRASESKLRDVLDAMFGFVGLFSTDGIVLEANRAPLDAAGLTREQVIGQRFENTYWWNYSPESQACLLELLRRAAKGETVRRDLVVRVKGGRMITIDTIFSPLRDPSGKVMGIVGFAVDVTEHRRDERLLQSLVESTSSAIGQKYIPTLVEQMAMMFGCKAAGLATFTADTVGAAQVTLAFHRESQFTLDSCDLRSTPCGQIRPGQTLHIPTNLSASYPHSDLVKRCSADSYLGLALTTGNDRLIGTLFIVDDKPMPDAGKTLMIMRILAIRAVAELEGIRADERLQAQQAMLTHASRLALVGGLASGLAHELNQPLCAIANYTRAAMHRLARPGADHVPVLEDLRQAGDQAERAGEIIRRLRQMVARRPGSPERIDLGQCIQTCLSLFKYETTRHKVTMSVRRGDDRILLLADAVQMQQVIMNLVQNAVDAVAGLEPARRKVTISLRRRNASQIELKVSDQGVGVAASQLEELFESFYSTKPDGLGLGLPICRTIIESYGGTIIARRNPRHGLTFTVLLPG